ncbi:hypothetical protein STAFG_7807 [Streptomyces afghaniensis 772]|uniref:Uncharacterized protein n=1 Tax=Streptomyces afghaniensis 772 TaxID=1283301 RepID=S4NAS7_9ACTN|nr:MULTISPECIES: hypothetical protein [Streptomyces]EPJ35144.1 hypothetical protein STAFG_7807 [Streptomyces afghaniensis 772]UOB08352.1 hypothetical protein MQE23_04445 [Streptomyces sp. HP-A2021]
MGRRAGLSLLDGRAFGVEFRDPAAFAKVFGVLRGRGVRRAGSRPREGRSGNLLRAAPDLLDIFN